LVKQIAAVMACPLNYHEYCQVNEFVKRVRAAKIHILIMGHLRKKMPAMMGKAQAQEKLLANLQAEFGMVQREYHLPAGTASSTSPPPFQC